MIVKYSLLGVVLASFFLTGCAAQHEEEKVLYKIIADHANFYEKRGFQADGTGGGIPKKITLIMISYRLKECVDLPTARKIWFGLAHKLLEIANTHPDLPRYGVQFPFTFDNIHICLTFVKKNGKYQDPPCIANIMNANHNLYYFISKDDDLVEIQKEDIYDLVKVPEIIP